MVNQFEPQWTRPILFKIILFQSKTDQYITVFQCNARVLYIITELIFTSKIIYIKNNKNDSVAFITKHLINPDTMTPKFIYFIILNQPT